MKEERRCSRRAVRRAAGRVAVPTWFRMFLTYEVMSEKTKRQHSSCKKESELMKKVKAGAAIQFTVRMSNRVIDGELEIFETVKKYEFVKKKSSKKSVNICLDAAVITSERYS